MNWINYLYTLIFGTSTVPEMTTTQNTAGDNMPEPPANWININVWHHYYSLKQKMAIEFSRIEKYISKFRQPDVEIIIPHLFVENIQLMCNCTKPCWCGPMPPDSGLGNSDLFRAILKKTRCN